MTCVQSFIFKSKYCKISIAESHIFADTWICLYEIEKEARVDTHTHIHIYKTNRCIYIYMNVCIYVKKRKLTYVTCFQFWRREYNGFLALATNSIKSTRTSLCLTIHAQSSLLPACLISIQFKAHCGYTSPPSNMSTALTTLISFMLWKPEGR